MTRAMTSPIIGQSVQCPPNQRCTAEYQRSVVGRKMNPRIGQRIESNIRSNQCVKNQSSATTNRGVASASSESRHGIGQDSSSAERFGLDASTIPFRGSAAGSSLRLLILRTGVSPALFVRETITSQTSQMTSGGPATRRTSEKSEIEPV